MSVSISVTLDVSALDAWGKRTTQVLRNNLRSAVDKSARYARAETIPAIEADLNVPRARFRAATPLVRRAPQAGPIVATWDLNKSRNQIRAAGMVMIAKGARGIVASTFATTGGGSASLNLPRGFVIEANGGRVVMTRTGRGRTAIKPVYAGNPGTDLGQADSMPRKVWTDAATRSVSALVPAAVQKAFDGVTGVAVAFEPKSEVVS